MTKVPENLEDRIKEIVAQQFDTTNDQIDIKKTFEDLKAGTVDIVELIMEVEEVFDINTGMEYYDDKKIKTVDDLVKIVRAAIAIED